VPRKLLIANRGEISIRVARTAAEMSIGSVAVYSEDDAGSLHLKAADEAVRLTGAGAAAYLDTAQIVRVARESGCDAIHPGYGFLSENAAFARLCADAGLVFVGPPPEALELFGDKVQARALAERAGAPVLPGSGGAVTLEQAKRFLADLGAGAAVMLKAVAGGGGRGMRLVERPEDLAAAYERCRSEALQAFGSGEVYVEQFLRHARHIEVQVLADAWGEMIHIWDRECSPQRQRQKLVETAPAFGLSASLRERLHRTAVELAMAAGHRNLGTFEFLVGGGGQRDDAFAFIEANPRLQVEHTVTEAVTGLDLVRLQLEIAGGRSLADLGLTQAEVPAPRGVAVQCRVNLETMNADGTARPAGGTLSAYEPPSGPGVRVDGFGYGGYRTSARFDSLLAKVVVHAPAGGLADAARKADRTLAEFRIEGVATNIPFLRALLRDPAFAAGEMHTGFVEAHIATLAAEATALTPAGSSRAPAGAGAKVDSVDPLAVLAHGQTTASPAAQEQVAFEALEGPDGTTALRAPLQGTILSIAAHQDQMLRAGEPVLVMESMKMEHVVSAPVSGILRLLAAAEGDTVYEGHPLAFIEPSDTVADAEGEGEALDLDHIRPDLAEVLDRRRYTLDAARPDAVSRRHAKGGRTARENVEDLLDPGSFIEYGAFTVAARRRRHSFQELIEQTPADGIVAGLGRVNGEHFSDEAARCAVMAYDYTVLAGTQGNYGHRKMDRLVEVTREHRLPTIFFCEGGGGRPGDTEGGGFLRGFNLWPRMSGVAPLIGVTTGRCFAGNAAFLGACDVIIATRGSNIGMGGPAMVEGGGLGVYRAEEIGPSDVQSKNGVIDVLVEDEANAVQVAKQYLSYFQGPLRDWSCADQRLLRRVVPENRRRTYDMRQLIDTLADTASVLELRPEFGTAMITALVRIEGRPIGLLANNPLVIGGAIDSDASDKGARFLQICEAFDLPVLSLCDTPGMMVGPEVEKTALVRHCSRLFVIGANLTVPILGVTVRKGYGLGGVAMLGGSRQASMFSIAWPTGEFGGMNLEGAVKLGFRKELEAIADPVERRAAFDARVAGAYERGKALYQASNYSFDDVIDPADTRRWIIGALRSLPQAPRRAEKKLPWIDTW